ncbi:MAG TPA: methionyl-tRNA formyltransferase [Candidatus Gastranaerophilales bacterium]|nr:methionyl-tRNA formyltransferase [Candidatus Gastranaerophilales bacterium]
MKIVFLGTPQIAVASFEYLAAKEDVQVLAVITQPDKPSGRGKKVCTTPICCAASGYGIPVYQPVSIKKDQELIKKLRELSPDFFVTFAFGQILSQEAIDIPKYGCVNLHASLLPKYRGANPIQAAIINGDKKTGISTMLTELGLDSGPVVLQKEIEITENMTSLELMQIISKTSPEFIYESLKKLKDGTIKPVRQNEEDVTLAPKLKKEDGHIDWSEPAEKIHDKIRGMKPWPGTYSFIHGSCVKITESRLNSEENINNANFGEIFGKINNGIKVLTGKGSLIITKLQPACKAEQDAVSWYNGARLQKGEAFEALDSTKALTCECKCESENN